MSGIPAARFAHTLIDAHVYTAKPDGSMAEFDHVPGLREQLTREPRSLPRLSIATDIRSLDDLGPLLEASTDDVMAAFRLDGYDPYPAITFRVAV
jgi:thymidylate synthase